MGIGIGLLWAVLFAVIAAVLAVIRTKNWGAAAGTAFAITFILALIADWAVHTRPTMTWPGLLPLVLVNILIVMFACWIADGVAVSPSAGTVVPVIALLIFSVVWLTGHGSGHGLVRCPTSISGIGNNGTACPVEAYGIVHVDDNPPGTLPASSTAHLVVVTPDEAYTRASQAMSSGLAGQMGFASFLKLGSADLQMVNGHMWYAFALSGSLHGANPGYIMISGENPGGPGTIIERYAPQYPNAQTTIFLGGQGHDPYRWALSHGYNGFNLDNATLEIPDGGQAVANGDVDPVPYWTITLREPKVGWTFLAPVGIITINAHTGEITRYGLPGRTAAQNGGYPPAPPWIDRVYSSQDAATIGEWYGNNAHRAWGGTGTTNRYTVSGDPVLVYTGDQNPSWRMLLTSFGTDVSTYRILEMDAATGDIRVYTPASAMPIESNVASVFCNGSGTGANGQGQGALNVKSSHLVPEAMALHLIYGQLTWMTSYEPAANNGASSSSAPDQQEGDNADPCGTGEAPVANPTYTGIGFVSAYNVSGNSVAAGNSLSAALANYLTQLATQPGSNGNAPGAGANQVTITGTIAPAQPGWPRGGVSTDTSGGSTVYYITLTGPGGKPDKTTVYTGTSAISAELPLANPGDHVTIRVLKVNAGPGTDQMQGFSDAEHPVAAAGA